MEKENDIFETYSFMKELNPPFAAIGIYKQLPRTTIYEKSPKFNLVYEVVDINHFYHTNPVDYYYRDPERRMAYIEKDRFETLYKEIIKVFYKHKTSIKKMSERAWSRRKMYIKNKSILFSDINKALQWFRVK